jgi:hypothetical protein
VNTYHALRELTHASHRALALAERADPTSERFDSWQLETARLIGRIFGFHSPYARAFNDIFYEYTTGHPEMSLQEQALCFDRGMVAARTLLEELCRDLQEAQKSAL